jgi:hypothetical protein
MECTGRGKLAKLTGENKGFRPLGSLTFFCFNAENSGTN